MIPRKHDEVLSLALEATQTAIWDWHLPSGRVVRTGPWYSMYGLEPDVERKTFAEWEARVHPEDRPIVERAIEGHLSGKTPEYFVEFRICRAPGDYRWIEGHGRVVERDGEGRAVRMVGTDSDVTERKRAERELAKAKHAAEAASRAKSEFLANVSHEIRTPMTAVLGYTDLLLNLDLPAEQRRQYLEIIHRNAEALLALMDDILDLSRIEAHKVTLHKVPCCPVEVAEPPHTSHQRNPSSVSPLPARLDGRVLIVEDSPDIQMLLRMLLEGVGLEVEVAANGRLGCEMAAHSRQSGRPYDAILMDIQMPEFDGYEATRRLRREGWPGPIVALTAHAMLGDREKCVAAGCDAYLAKPIDQPTLLHTLARHLQQPAPRPAANASPLPAAAPVPLGAGVIASDRLAALVAGFAAELPERADRVAAAWQAGNVEAMRAAAHQLKGTAGAYGYRDIADAAEAVCRAAEGPTDAHETAAHVARLESLCSAAAQPT